MQLCLEVKESGRLVLALSGHTGALGKKSKIHPRRCQTRWDGSVDQRERRASFPQSE
jgi:hypothetical protein